MIIIIDSGAGGFAVSEQLRKAGFSVRLFEDSMNFPYGKKSPDFIKNRIRDLTTRLRKFEPGSKIFLACNTASFYSESDPSVMRLPKPDSSTFDYFLGSSLSCRLFNSTLDGTDLIAFAENLHRTGSNANTDLIGETFKAVPYGSRVYLGSTHFTFIKTLLQETRPDLTFLEPDYISIVSLSPSL